MRRLISMIGLAAVASAHAGNGYTTLDLGTLGGVSGVATDGNSLGEVVGIARDPDGNTRVFLWTIEEGMVDLGTFGGTDAWASGINDDGVIVGSYVRLSAHWKD